MPGRDMSGPGRDLIRRALIVRTRWVTELGGYTVASVSGNFSAFGGTACGGAT